MVRFIKDKRFIPISLFSHQTHFGIIIFVVFCILHRCSWGMAFHITHCLTHLQRFKQTKLFDRKQTRPLRCPVFCRSSAHLTFSKLNVLWCYYQNCYQKCYQSVLRNILLLRFIQTLTWIILSKQCRYLKEMVNKC